MDEFSPTTPWLSPGTVRLPGEKGEEYRTSADSLPSLEEMEREAARRRSEAIVQYARRWLPDADTTDEESRRRHKAEEIVDRAIEAMGGLERMQKLRNKKTVISGYRPKKEEWYQKSETHHAEGRKFVERGLERQWTRGFDGQQTWAYTYGMPVPANAWSLQHQAERWDFLSRFKGADILLDYLGARQLSGGRTCETILVEDLKYGTRREACFDPRTHLLVSTTERETETEIHEYKEVSGVLTPYETWTHYLMFVNRNRYDVEYNLDLDDALFSDPGPRTWAADPMSRLLHQKASGVRTLRLEEIAQVITGWKANGQPVDVVLDDVTRRLLEFYLTQKLKAASAWNREEPDLRARITIRGFFQAQTRPPACTIHLHLLIEEHPGNELVWEQTVSRRWEGSCGIDGECADDLTSLLADAIGGGLEARTVQLQELFSQGAAPAGR